MYVRLGQKSTEIFQSPISQNNLYGMMLVYLRLNCAMKATCKKNITCPGVKNMRNIVEFACYVTIRAAKFWTQVTLKSYCIPIWCIWPHRWTIKKFTKNKWRTFKPFKPCFYNCMENIKGSRHYSPSHKPSWTAWRIYVLVKKAISTFQFSIRAIL